MPDIEGKTEVWTKLKKKLEEDSGEFIEIEGEARNEG